MNHYAFASHCFPLMDLLSFTKICFCQARGKTHLETQKQVPEWSGWHGSTVRIQLLFTPDSCMDSIEMSSWTNPLSASVPHACKLCSGVFPLERKFVYSTYSSSSCFPSHQHSPRWSHGSSTAQGFKWRQKRLKSVLFLPPVDQLAKWQDHCPLSLEEGVGAQFGCAHGGTLSHWSCPFALSHGTWKPIQLEKSKHRWS